MFLLLFRILVVSFLGLLFSFSSVFATEEREYGGQVEQVQTSPEGKLTRYTYSGGQVATLTRGTNSETSTGSFTTTAYGRILTATDGDNYTKTSTYTPWDLLSTGTTSEGIITSYAYDAMSRPTSESQTISGSTKS